MMESTIAHTLQGASDHPRRESPGGPDLEQPDTAAPKPPLEAGPGDSRRTSVILREYASGLGGTSVNLGSLRYALGDRGFGMLIFVFALPNLIPVNIPLLSAVLGVPLVLLAAQLFWGRHEPWFPAWLARRAMPSASFEAVLRRSLPYLQRAESVLRPRLTPILSWTGERLIGFALLVLTVVLTLPIPFGNWLPAFAIAILGLAIAEKDGVAVLVGLVVGVVSLFVAGTVVVGLVKGFLLFLSKVAA
jgi:hypothetical protein